MPLAEIFNALLITYMATEYSLTLSSSSSSSNSNKNGVFIKIFLSARHNQVVSLVVLSINLIDELLAESTATMFVKRLFERLLHAPKIVLAAALYIAVLYVDCLRHSGNQQLTARRFLGSVSVQFVKALPLYPLLVIMISCGFMFLISALEHLNLPLEWLNWPLYYGTLYGPFSFVYFKVKAKIVIEGRFYIPISTEKATPSGPSSSDEMSLRNLRFAHFGNDATKTR